MTGENLVEVNSSIIEKIVNALQGDENYEVIDAQDNTEIRGSNMVSVAIDNTEQLNFALPDYRHSISVYVSTYVEEDKTGELFNNTWKTVKRKLDQYVMKETPLVNLFDGIPVVGFMFDNAQTMLVDDTYGKCYLAHLTYTAITSF